MCLVYFVVKKFVSIRVYSWFQFNGLVAALAVPSLSWGALATAWTPSLPPLNKYNQRCNSTDHTVIWSSTFHIHERFLHFSLEPLDLPGLLDVLLMIRRNQGKFLCNATRSCKEAIRPEGETLVTACKRTQ